MAEHDDLVAYHKQKLEYYQTGDGQYHPNVCEKLQVGIIRHKNFDCELF